MYSRWYDRQGKPLQDYSDIENKLSNDTYKRVAETTLSNGLWVSTVWLGLDHSFNDTIHLIFETMVFESREKLEEIDVQRYSTENEAILGHQEMVEKWQTKDV